MFRQNAFFYEPRFLRTLLMALSVIARIVKDGFTPGLAEIAEPSQTNMFL